MRLSTMGMIVNPSPGGTMKSLISIVIRRNLKKLKRNPARAYPIAYNAMGGQASLPNKNTEYPAAAYQQGRISNGKVKIPL